MNEAPEDGSIPEDPERAARQSRSRPFAVGDPVPGLSSWLLERRLGGGGFGEVWLVKHELKSERRAVKFCTHPEIRNRLVVHEKKVVARVMKEGGNHPNIVPLLEHNLDGDTPWLMYEFVEGGTLADAIDSWRPLPVEERARRAVRTLHTLAAALATFHRLDPPIVHRDLKPLNVLMAGEVPRITDFGIGSAAVEAALSHSRTRDSVALPSFLHGSGSQNYASPEQRVGSPPNPRDDVFSLGVIAYQMLVADTKYAPGTDAADELSKRRVPDELTNLVTTSVALNPERRPKDAGDWRDRLAPLLSSAELAGTPRRIALPELPLFTEDVRKVLDSYLPEPLPFAEDAGETLQGPDTEFDPVLDKAEPAAAPSISGRSWSLWRTVATAALFLGPPGLLVLWMKLGGSDPEMDRVGRVVVPVVGALCFLAGGVWVYRRLRKGADVLSSCTSSLFLGAFGFGGLWSLLTLLYHYLVQLAKSHL
jgi:serine/threonine protein kinase